jgi:GT2 family glycosyltransferase/glycosyltransferase involved in cell wall biosynthesis
VSATAGTNERRKVALVVLTWNAVAYTKLCFDSLFTRTNHPAWRLIVVDNGSTDGTMDYLRGLAQVTLIENANNLGFTKGVNQGLAVTAPDEDVVLLNNDIVVEDSWWLQRLQDVAYSGPDVGVVGSRLVEASGRINHLGSYMQPVTFYGQQMGGLELDINQAVRDREVECVVFALAYVTRACLDKVGTLDEVLFAYFEDTDYCFRASRAGFKVLYAGGVCPTHHHNTSTRENRVDFWSIYSKSRKTFQRKWARWLDEDRYDVGIGWHSVVHRPLGYALHSRKMMTAMNFAGIRVAYQNAYLERDDPTDQPLINDLMLRSGRSNATQVAYCQADAFHRVKGRHKVGFSMLEVTGLPHDWVRGCNSMDEVWVPASFNVQTFQDSGVTVPIHVMPLGIDPDYLHPGIKGFRPSSKFTFLSVFEWGERKAPEVLLRAFATEFRPTEDVFLLLSVFNRDPTIDIQTEIAKLGLPASAPVVVMVNPEFADYQMGSLYRSADCFVLPTRGEGWGMPVLEAMACGLPTIATNWGGVADFLDESVGYPLNVRAMVPAEARCPYYTGFSWAEPDFDHLRARMRQVVNDQDAAAARGLAASRRAAERYTWAHAAERIKDRLTAIG